MKYPDKLVRVWVEAGLFRAFNSDIYLTTNQMWWAAWTLKTGTNYHSSMQNIRATWTVRKTR